MTVNSTTSRVSYTGNGSTVTFTVPYYFLSSSDLVVIKTSSAGVQTTLVLSTDYTVSGAGSPSGGSITCTTAPSLGETLVIFRDPAATQLTDYQANDPFPAETHERALDKLTMLVQRSKDLINRSFTLSDGDTSGASTQLPIPTPNNVIGWNATATGLQNVTPQTLATIVSSGQTYADIFTGTGAQTAFTLSNNPGSLYNMDVSVGGVTQLPNTDYTWVSGTTLTFTTAPPNGAKVLVRYSQALVDGTTDSSSVNFLQAGTGASVRTAQSKLRDVVSALDFGVVGNGVADDTSALQAAINAAASGSKKLYIPTGIYKTTSGLSFGSPIRIFGDGFDVTNETGSIIKPTQSSGIALTFTNATGSFDNGLILEDFAIIGTGSGTADGLEVNGAVWTNSRVRNVTVKSMGGKGIIIDDCLTANFEAVRAQGCGSDGFNISGSNGIRLYGCMSESNGGYGFYFTSNLTAGERNGPLMLACHAEENTGGDAVYMNQFNNPMIQGCWLQVASASNVDRAAIHLDTCTGAMVSGNLLTSNSAWALFQGVKLSGSLYCSVVSNNISGFTTARAIVENSTSGRNLSFGNRGDGTQGAAGFTSSSTTGSVFHTHMGSGGNYGQEWTAGYHAFKNTAGTEVLAAGTDTLALGVSLGSTNVRLAVKANSGKRAAVFQRSNGDNYCYFDNDNPVSGSPNAADAVLFFNKITSNNRSINAAGTLNASGADYAEYEDNNGLDISKGSIVGFKADGTLTLTYSEAVRFGIKSTSPAYVGGDTWGVGLSGQELEAARQRVDRIAYAGKVPVNVSGATPGDYIVAVALPDGSVGGASVASPTFEQYRNVVGRVNRILDDGRAEVAVVVH